MVVPIRGGFRQYKSARAAVALRVLAIIPAQEDHMLLIQLPRNAAAVLVVPVWIDIATHRKRMVKEDLEKNTDVRDEGCSADGTANPAIAKMMKVDIKDLKSAEVQAMSDDDIKKVITGGKGKMRPVNSVSGPALDDVVAYVRSLKK